MDTQLAREQIVEALSANTFISGVSSSYGPLDKTPFELALKIYMYLNVISGLRQISN